MNVIVYLRGGLGNQLFQYACGLSLASSFRNGQLIVDDSTGFSKDKAYKRKLKLHFFGAKYKRPSHWCSLILWVYYNILRRILIKFYSYLDLIHINIFNWSFVIEINPKHIHDLKSLNLKKNIVLDGYWQSEKYFNEKVVSDLQLPTLESPKAFALLKEIQSAQSVSLGLRLYEETSDPSKYFRSGKVLEVLRINETIRSVLKENESLQFFIFSTKYSPKFSELMLPKKTVMIIGDDLDISDVETLVLFAHSDVQIITNSSFYWWGAWFSERIKTRNYIFAYDDFLGEKTLPSRWEKI